MTWKVEPRTGKKKRYWTEYYLVAARTPLEAARLLVGRFKAVKALPLGRSQAHVCEQRWNGRPGFKPAADHNGDKRYDVDYRPQHPDPARRLTVVYSEKSWA